VYVVYSCIVNWKNKEMVYHSCIKTFLNTLFFTGISPYFYREPTDSEIKASKWTIHQVSQRCILIIIPHNYNHDLVSRVFLFKIINFSSWWKLKSYPNASIPMLRKIFPSSSWLQISLLKYFLQSIYFSTDPIRSETF